MKITELLQSPTPIVSFEFFPPRTEEGQANLLATVSALKELKPSFVTMTYGAGGSTREKTVQLVSHIRNRIGIEAAAHLTCVGHTRLELENILSDLQKAGIENIVALRGDPPKGQTHFVPVKDGFRNAVDLVRLIKNRFSFCVAVAGYPEKHVEAPSYENDLVRLKEKVAAGADVIVTQLFFSNQRFFDFVERLRAIGVTVPVLAGIMPVTDVDQIKRFTTMCGATIPADLLRKLEAVKNDKEGVVRTGIEFATEQCGDLLRQGARGIHFYTLNKSHSTREIYMNLRKKGLL